MQEPVYEAHVQSWYAARMPVYTQPTGPLAHLLYGCVAVRLACRHATALVTARTHG